MSEAFYAIMAPGPFVGSMLHIHHHCRSTSTTLPWQTPSGRARNLVPALCCAIDLQAGEIRGAAMVYAKVIEWHAACRTTGGATMHCSTIEEMLVRLGGAHAASA